MLGCLYLYILVHVEVKTCERLIKFSKYPMSHVRVVGEDCNLHVMYKKLLPTAKMMLSQLPKVHPLHFSISSYCIYLLAESYASLLIVAV
jgi:hypothetical protein